MALCFWVLSAPSSLKSVDCGSWIQTVAPTSAGKGVLGSRNRVMWLKEGEDGMRKTYWVSEIWAGASRGRPEITRPNIVDIFSFFWVDEWMGVEGETGGGV